MAEFYVIKEMDGENKFLDWEGDFVDGFGDAIEYETVSDAKVDLRDNKGAKIYKKTVSATGIEFKEVDSTDK